MSDLDLYYGTRYILVKKCTNCGEYSNKSSTSCEHCNMFFNGEEDED